MTFSCYELQDPLEITENRAATLVIENRIFYRNFIEDLLLQTQNCSSRFAVFSDDEPLNISKCVEFITDIFSLPFDSRAIQSKINQIAAEEYAVTGSGSADILNKINGIGADIVSSLNFEISYSPLSDLSGILKLLSFRIESENLSFPERIVEYISFLSFYCGKKLFIVLNLKSALNKKEFSEFLKLICYKRINLLLIENQKSEYTDKNESIRIIDSDLCEISGDISEI